MLINYSVANFCPYFLNFKKKIEVTILLKVYYNFPLSFNNFHRKVNYVSQLGTTIFGLITKNTYFQGKHEHMRCFVSEP